MSAPATPATVPVRRWWTAEATAIAGVGVALLMVAIGYLAPLRTDLRDMRADLAALRGDVADVRTDLHGLGERVARIEGALTGPWRPANGAPTPAPSTKADP